MQRYTVYLYLETTLHVLRGTFTHHQERIHMYLQHLVFVTPLLLYAAMVEEWNRCGCAVGGVRHPQHTQIPDAVDTFVCASDDGWNYYPKHVE
jgi:hypothetical protein